MPEHAARDGAALGVGTERERRAEVAHRQPPVRSVDPVEGTADDRANREDDGHRQHADASDHAYDRQILDAMTERRWLLSQQGLARDRGRRQGHRQASDETRAVNPAPL